MANEATDFDLRECYLWRSPRGGVPPPTSDDMAVLLAIDRQIDAGTCHSISLPADQVKRFLHWTPCWTLRGGRPFYAGRPVTVVK
jgi:hypothetical protein